MLIQLNSQQAKLKDELREYFKGLITPELKTELNNPEHFEGGGPEFKSYAHHGSGWMDRP